MRVISLFFSRARRNCKEVLQCKTTANGEEKIAGMYSKNGGRRRKASTSLLVLEPRLAAFLLIQLKLLGVVGRSRDGDGSSVLVRVVASGVAVGALRGEIVCGGKEARLAKGDIEKGGRRRTVQLLVDGPDDLVRDAAGNGKDGTGLCRAKTRKREKSASVSASCPRL